MNIVLGAFVALAALAPPQTLDEIYQQAYLNCISLNVSERVLEEKLEVLDNLTLVESAFFQRYPEFPESLRGILIAAACRESGFNPKARGDWRTRRGRRVAMAHGIVQMWPWWEKEYQLDRDNYVGAAAAWLEQIARQHAKNTRRKRCPRTFSVERQWVAAWVQTTRGGRINRSNHYRCFEVPSHYKTLKKWRRNIQAVRKKMTDDGC
jgi:hypothetical protein